jgi:hypothetical protein
MLSDETACLRQTFDIAVDIDTRIGKFTGTLTGEDKNRADAPVDVDQGVVFGGARAVGQRIELFLEFGETLGKRP